MKKLFLLGVLLVTFTQCSKTEFEQEIPDVSVLTPQNIKSELKRVDLNVDEGDWNNMISNYQNNIEVRCEVSFYSENGELILEKKSAELKLRGVGSTSFPMKPLGILFDEPQSNENGKLLRPNQVMSKHNLDFIQNIRLRNSGNDYGKTQIKDAVLTEFAIQYGLNVELKYSEPVHVFVNNEYYGFLNLRNEADEVALAHLYKVGEDEITYVKVNKATGNLNHKHGDKLLVDKLRNAIRNRDTEMLTKMIDLDSYIDYILIEDYFSNDDWPGNNVAAYSINGAPFKFVLYDLDQALFRTKNPVLPELEYLSADVAKIYQGLMKDSAFISRVESRQRDLYSHFSPVVFNEIVDQSAFRVKNDIPFLTAKWGIPESSLQWQVDLEVMKREFERTDHNNRKHYGL